MLVNPWLKSSSLFHGRLRGGTSSCKQILPAGCTWNQGRGQVSTLTQSEQSACHCLKIESSLQSGLSPPPARLAGGDGEGLTVFEQGHIPGEWFLPQLHTGRAVPAVCLQPPLKGDCYTTVMSSGMFLVIYSVT